MLAIRHYRHWSTRIISRPIQLGDTMGSLVGYQGEDGSASQETGFR